MDAAEPWSIKAKDRRVLIAAQIPAAWKLSVSVSEATADVAATGLLSAHELDITRASVGILLEKLHSGQWSSESVTTAFCKRAAVAQQCLNVATELMFDEAIDTARQYDRHLAETGSIKGPLHGLPISVKDIFDVAGHISTAGFVSRLDDVAKEDGLLVAAMKEAGAIPFIKTNISQGCLLVESINNIFGTVLNPSNKALSAGGSSGGE
jgi:amidase